MPTLDKLLEEIGLDPISFDKFNSPIIASDLHIYDARQYDQLVAASPLSPVSRTAFLPPPFPFLFVKMLDLCSERSGGAPLRDLITCPVTQIPMKIPVIAHMVATDVSGVAVPFVLVCDKSALNPLPAGYSLVNIRDWDDLKAIIEHPELQQKLEAEVQKLDPKVQELVVEVRKLEAEVQKLRTEVQLDPEALGRKWGRIFGDTLIDFPGTMIWPGPATAPPEEDFDEPVVNKSVPPDDHPMNPLLQPVQRQATHREFKAKLMAIHKTPTNTNTDNNTDNNNNSNSNSNK